MSAITEKMLVTPDGVPMDRIVGFETEYSVAVWRAMGGKIEHDDKLVRLLTRLMCYGDWSKPFDVNREMSSYVDEAMLSRQAHLGRQFQASGDRIYLDVGDHPELSTAEDTLFLDAAYRMLAGHVTMGSRFEIAQTAEEYKRRAVAEGYKAYMFANTTTGTVDESWASHQNILVPRLLEQPDYETAMAISHLSRIVWSGAGSPARTKDGSYRFTLSEKAPFIVSISSDKDMEDRPLVHERDEPLADQEKYRRLHDVSGETVFSPLVNALRLAADSIILRACELGVKFDDLMPENPVRAMQIISNDPTLKATVRINRGGAMTGIQLQRALMTRSMGAAERAGYITDQEWHYGHLLLELLDKLEHDPSDCNDVVDWVTKQRAIEREFSKRHEADNDGAKKQPLTDSEIAWNKSAEYHRIGPKMGMGMLLLQRGKFLASPTLLQLQHGLALPETRAKVRGEAVLRAVEHGMRYMANWHKFELLDYAGSWRKLPDPYNTDLTLIDELFSLAA